jgi:hypothetical protein
VKHQRGKSPSVTEDVADIAVCTHIEVSGKHVSETVTSGALRTTAEAEAAAAVTELLGNHICIASSESIIVTIPWRAAHTATVG